MSTLIKLAELCEQRSAELAKLAPPGARPPLHEVAGHIRRQATPSGTSQLAIRLADEPFDPGRNVDGVLRKFAARHVGPQGAPEAFAQLASALLHDNRMALEEVQAHPVPATRDDAIRAARAEGKSFTVLAQEFGMSRGRIHAIVHQEDT